MIERTTAVGSSNSAFNRDSFANLLSQLRGKRGIEEMSKDTGMSVSFLTKALSRQLPTRPSKRSLMKLADPTANPQYQVSLRSLMEACGYTDAVEDDAPKGVDVRVPRKTSVINAISLYYDSTPIACAMGMLTSALIAKGVGPQMNIQMRGSYFEIEDAAQDFRCVGISGFCQDKAGIQAMELVIKTRIFDALCAEEAPNAAYEKIYYILTDDREIFRFCKEQLPRIQARAMVILYTEDHVRFVDESRMGSETEQKELFPASLC